jgi:hypothetical protein
MQAQTLNGDAVEATMIAVASGAEVTCEKSQIINTFFAQGLTPHTRLSMATRRLGLPRIRDACRQALFAPNNQKYDFMRKAPKSEKGPESVAKKRVASLNQHAGMRGKPNGEALAEVDCRG